MYLLSVYHHLSFIYPSIMYLLPIYQHVFHLSMHLSPIYYLSISIMYVLPINHLSIHLSCIYRPSMFTREGFTLMSWLTQSWRLAARIPVDEGRPRGADGEAACSSRKAGERGKFSSEGNLKTGRDQGLRQRVNSL